MKQPSQFILLVGKKGESMSETETLLRDAGYGPVPTDVDQAIGDLSRFRFHAVVVSRGVTAPARERMIGAYRSVRPDGKVFELDAPRRLLESVRRALYTPTTSVA